jgi:two-component sensor histidine kinase
VSFAPSCEGCAIVDEANHRIANHLTLLGAYVRLRAGEIAANQDAPSRQDVQFLLESIRVQLDLIAQLHRAMANAVPTGPDALAQSLAAVCDALGGALPPNVVLERVFGEGLRVAPTCLLPLTQIVAEAVTNAVKHAVRDRAETILVCARQDADGAILVEVIDSGPGLPADFEPDRSGGLGLRLMRALSRQMGATLQFERRPVGMAVRVTLRPVAAPV